MGGIPDQAKCPRYRRCPYLGGVRKARFHYSMCGELEYNNGKSFKKNMNLSCDHF